MVEHDHTRILLVRLAIRKLFGLLEMRTGQTPFRSSPPAIGSLRAMEALEATVMDSTLRNASLHLKRLIDPDSPQSRRVCSGVEDGWELSSSGWERFFDLTVSFAKSKNLHSASSTPRTKRAVNNRFHHGV